MPASGIKRCPYPSAAGCPFSAPWQLITVPAQGLQQGLAACQQPPPKNKGNLGGKQVIKQFY